MLIVGLALLLLGFLLGIHILWVLGIAGVVIGFVLVLLGYAGHSVGGRRWW